ncbi:hypothetical protein [Xanthomonas campestris]|uniref:hypothetical protein n=1 Tax=Xanthomonas campestris TaxID=339 RepID=UPI003557D2C1
MTVVSGAFMAEWVACLHVENTREIGTVGRHQPDRALHRAGTYIVKLDGASFDGVSLLARQ